MADYINLNGAYYDINTPVLHAGNRAFCYGDGLFETIRVIDGKPCFLNLHFERLTEGMRFLKMNIPLNFSATYLEKEITSLLDKNNIKGSARVRVSVYRENGGFYTPFSGEISFLLETKYIEQNYYSLNARGLSIDIYEEQKKHSNKLNTIKSANALIYVLAGIWKKEKGMDDCILLNETGNIAEATNSNVFVVFNGVFYTPSINQGCIPGVMRQNIISILKKQGSEVQECPLNPSALLRADEVFFTNVINGIQWVGAYKMKRYFNNACRVLVESLNKMVEAETGNR